jgi:hypothetical protein
MNYMEDPLPPNIELTTQHTVHRSASKAYSRPPDAQTGWPRWALPLTAVIAAVSLGIAAASAALLLSYKSTAGAQISQLQAAVSNAQAGNQSNTGSIAGLSGKVATLNAGMAPFSQVCSTDLTDASGQPAAFYFMCSPTKP